MTTDKELANKVLGIYFRMNYNIYGSKNSPEDLAFIKNNTFKVIVTDKSKKNGYVNDSDKVAKKLELYKPYELEIMYVGQSSSTIKLVDFPYESFNSVNFEFLPLEELKINTTDIFELTIIQKELRDKHQIYVEVNTDCTTAPKFCYRITQFIGNPLDLTEKEWYWGTLDNPDKWFLYRKYEDALKDGLQEASLLILK